MTDLALCRELDALNRRLARLGLRAGNLVMNNPGRLSRGLALALEAFEVRCATVANDCFNLAYAVGQRVQ